MRVTGISAPPHRAIWRHAAGVPTAWVSPLRLAYPDYAGHVLAINFNFDAVTLALGTVTVSRHPACMYQNLYFGRGPDGTPDTTLIKITGVAPTALTAIPAATITALGWVTLTDVLAAAQFTAGP